MQAPSVVSAKDLCLTYQANDGPVRALSNVNLDVRKGDFVSFIGPSGCGKTTFLRVIADLEKSTSGEISINGMTPEEARKARAYGYVFQALKRSIPGAPSKTTSPCRWRSWAIPAPTG